MVYKQRVSNELYVWMFNKGKAFLLLKKWLNTGTSRVFYEQEGQ